MEDALEPEARRLHRLRGEWVLEVRRYQPMSRSHYRRVLSRVDGQQAILRTLRNRPLAEATTALFAEPPSEDTSYDAADASWAPSAEPAEEWLHAPPGTGSTAFTGSARRAPSSHDVSMLEAELARARDRVTALERKVAALTAIVQQMRADPVRGAASSEPDLPLPQDRPIGRSAGPEALGRTQPRQALGEPATEPEPPPPAPARPTPAFLPPEASQVVAILLKLIDGLSPPRETNPTVWNEGAWGCPVLNDREEVVGVMLADTAATVMLGGRLLMLPDDRLREMVQTGGPDEDIRECMGEVFNTLTSAVNARIGNGHVRAGALEWMASVPEFVAESVSRVDFVEDTGGRFAIIAGWRRARETGATS